MDEKLTVEAAAARLGTSRTELTKQFRSGRRYWVTKNDAYFVEREPNPDSLHGAYNWVLTSVAGLFQGTADALADLLVLNATVKTLVEHVEALEKRFTFKLSKPARVDNPPPGPSAWMDQAAAAEYGYTDEEPF